MIKIAIIFPVFNGLKFTQNCLQSFYTDHEIDQLDAEFIAVIVDDGSTDGSAEWIKENYPQVKVLNGTGDLWWSGGMNMGIDFAIHKLRVDYILWWNNDIVASEKYFKNLISIVKDLDHKTIVGPKINLDQNRNIVWSMGGYFDPISGEKDMRGREEVDGKEYNKVVECDWLPGMGTLTHVSVYNEIGKLDEKNFPQYHGDSDFTYRAKKNGYKVIVNPILQLYNDTRNSGLKHSESFKRLFQSLFSIRSNFNIRKEFIFYQKHSKSIKAYSTFFRKYFTYVGGFFKWKILGLFGLTRK